MVSLCVTSGKISLRGRANVVPPGHNTLVILRCYVDVSVLWDTGRDWLRVVGHLKLSVVFRNFASHIAFCLFIWGLYCCLQDHYGFCDPRLGAIAYEFLITLCIILVIFLIFWRLL